MITVCFDRTPALLSRAGVGTYVGELNRALERIPDVRLVESAHSMSTSNSTIDRVSGGLLREGWYYPVGLRRVAKRARADLLHVPAALPAYGRDLPTVLSILDTIPWRHPEWFTRANALQQRLLLPRAARQATRIITISEASKRDIIEYLRLPPDRIDVTPLGVDPSFSPSHRDPDWLRKRFATRGPVVLSVGTPEPRKNLRQTIAVFEQVHRQLGQASLLLVGGHGWRDAEIERAIDAAGPSVIRSGYLDRDELVRSYASADCFLFPSLREGFGLPPLEAMASGIPVVCSDSPSLPEVVGDAALMRPAEDTDGLAKAVLAVLTDDSCAEGLRTRGLERSARFTWEATAEATLATYRRAIGT